jgi:hypothetical protein
MTDPNCCPDAVITDQTAQLVVEDDCAVIVDVGVAGPPGPQGPPGAQGPPGIEIDCTPPVDVTILWADECDPGDMVIPAGGTTAQSLVKLSNSDYDSGWAYTLQSPRPPVAGKLLPRPLMGGFTSSSCGAFEQLRVNFFPVGRPCVIGKLSVFVSTQSITPNTAMRVGFYAVAANGLPGSLLLDAGLIDVTSTGIKTVDFTATPLPVPIEGVWVANCWQQVNSSFAVRAFQSAGLADIVNPFGPPDDTTTASLGTPDTLAVSGVSGALPVSPTFTMSTATNVPRYAIEVVSVP